MNMLAFGYRYPETHRLFSWSPILRGVIMILLMLFLRQDTSTIVSKQYKMIRSPHLELLLSFGFQHITALCLGERLGAQREKLTRK